MLKKALALGTAVGLGMTLVTGITAQASSPLGTHESVRTLTFQDKTTSGSFQDNAPKNDSPGDYFVFAEDVYKNGKKVGWLAGQSTIVRTVKKSGKLYAEYTLESVTAHLPGGLMTFSGGEYYRVADEGSETKDTVAITGGTGIYKDARGQATDTDTSESTDTVVITLIRG
jgi:hypothetical protein